MRKTLFFMLLCVLSFTGYANWGPAVSGKFLSKGLFQTGVENNQTRALFLCRVRYLGSWQIGKTWLGYFHCNFPYSGREIIAAQYEVFYGQPAGHWRQFRGRLPWHARAFGRDTNGNTLYLCQGRYQGGLEPGKTWQNYSFCNISYGGKEIRLSNFSVFVGANARRYHHRGYHHRYPHQECVHNDFGTKVCGYSCVKTLLGMQCASTPAQQCMADSFGHIACGYNCASSGLQVRCADSRFENCVADSFGHVRCGRGCRLNSTGHVVCR